MKKLSVFMGSALIAMMVSVNVLSSQEDEEIISSQVIDSKYEMYHPFGGVFGPGVGPKAMAKRQAFRKGYVAAEAERKVMEIVSKNDPSLAEKLRELKKNRPNRYMQIIKVSANLFDLSGDGISEVDIVRGIALEIETRDLASKYSSANSSEKDKIRSEMRKKLADLFDIRTRIMEVKIKRLESKIKDLKDDIERRKQNRSKIIDDRVNDLLRDRALRW